MAWSPTRRAEILEAAGPDASARSRQVAALTTREAKERDVSRVELIERWQRRAEEIGLDREALRRTLDPVAFRSPPAPAADAELRREAMVADWHESFTRGEDAVMVAKRNVEVERLNAMARQTRQEAGELGASEIEVGEARFAAGDLIITRVNDHAGQIYNRERWLVEEVDAERQKVVLQGLDQARQVELDADYLAHTNPLQRCSGARTRLRRNDLLGAGNDRRPGLRHGRPFDGQAGDVRRSVAQPRRDLSLRDAGDPGRP